MVKVLTPVPDTNIEIVSDSPAVQEFMKENNLLPDSSGNGDVNGDGETSLLDVITLQKYILKQATFTQEQAATADINGDGKVNVIDLAIMKQKVFGTYINQPDEPTPQPTENDDLTPEEPTEPEETPTESTSVEEPTEPAPEETPTETVSEDVILPTDAVAVI